MMYDLRTLLRLRFALTLRASRTWLSFLGIDADDNSLVNQLYAVYIAIFLACWFVLMSGWALTTATSISRLLGPAERTATLSGLAWVLTGALVLALGAALRGSPLKLTAPDMAYVAGSPLSRRAITLTGFLGAIPLLALACCGIIAALSVVLSAPGERSSLQTAFPAVLAMLIFTLFVLGAVWLLGIARLSLPPSQRFWLWLVPLAAAALPFALPTVGLWPAQSVSNAIGLHTVGLESSLLLVIALLLIVGTIWLGARVVMTDVIDESQFYAQVRSVGMYMFADMEMARRMLSQAGKNRRVRRPAGNLPRFQGAYAPFGRALLQAVRRPLTLVLAFLWGATLLYAGAWVLTMQPTLQQAMTWLFVALLVPPTALGSVYRDEASNPFLRQLVPISSLQLLIADALPTLVVLIAGGFTPLALGIFPLEQPLFGIPVLIALAPIFLLCQGLSAAPLRGQRGRLPYAVLAAISLGAVLLLNRLTGSPLVTTGSAALVALVLAQMMTTAP